MNIVEKINEKSPYMTRKQKLVAEYMRDNLDTMSYITLRELSQETGVTEMTILNACMSMGYSSFNEVKYECRKQINKRNKELFHQENEYFTTDIPKADLTDQEKLLMEICEEEKEQMDNWARNFNSRKMMEAAELFFKFKKIIICGRGISYLMAEYLKTGLAGVKIGSIIVNTELNESIYAATPFMDKKSLVVIISFPDYYFMTEKIGQYAKKNATVLAITDKEDNEIARYADMVLTVPSMTRMALNTLSTPMGLINLLFSAIKIKADEIRKDREGFHVTL